MNQKYEDLKKIAIRAQEDYRVSLRPFEQAERWGKVASRRKIVSKQRARQTRGGVQTESSGREHRDALREKIRRLETAVANQRKTSKGKR